MQITGKSICVFGSRTLNDDRIEAELAKIIDANEYRIIVTALDPGGVCERVKHFAKVARIGITLIQIGLDKKRARGMHEARSIAALNMADHMLAIWDGKSKGTENEIRLAKKMGVPTTIIILDPLPTERIDMTDYLSKMPDVKSFFDVIDNYGLSNYERE